jgi:hypothetical protein
MRRRRTGERSRLHPDGYLNAETRRGWLPAALAGNAFLLMAGKGNSPVGAVAAPDDERLRDREGVDPRPTPRREKQTIVPPFDPEMLARELEAAAARPTVMPPFDTSSYARIVDEHIDGNGAGHDTPRTLTAVTPGLAAGVAEDLDSSQSSGTIGRAMYGSYLQSDYPEALVLAERVLALEPEHALAILVVEGCRDRLGLSAAGSDAARLVPSSVVRLRRPVHEFASLAGLEPDLTSQIVLGHVDGVSSVSTVADLAGIPRPEALDRLHALLDLGLLEVVNG